ncbi:glycine--tRNA ligase subunit beta [Sphingomonas sanguinis]|jgi:glycyl-tRNA synthetase beta chain|uniref:Glycine--tRNA ligase beta subunit n=1 Tax=Sphingomonas sanguinis TaxID=33051 RepID=A0A7Y7QT80_9SPHN|nr:glycine--tRNA ligase subunit beta [Sphingomonas sanguinis]MBZ6380719.1 glycine--tRNA ligase subunit beta [Sphingomonas sanguinis]NNG49470.1 glycine--tRNA ligase subunit beta [Sphingomonas sanguinis]NNG53352.1 glycine--tRNA ligase subunit beta [Sphingomonas sanguinis]NVP30021.1 glycine--tRNA ligase subunit beta [Sphingomonas sanguinis]
MTDFLLELRSEEIPARMQAGARENLAKLFAAELAKAGLSAGEIVTYAGPRRLALIARGLPSATEAVSEEVKGPRASAPPQALEGFLRKTGLTREQLTERDGVLFAITEKPGRATAQVLAEAIPAIVRAFPWPKSMRWGGESASTESMRWVRPLHAIVALFGGEVVPFEIAGITSGNTTRGHRFHAPAEITLTGVDTYVEQLRAAKVLVDQDERAAIIRERASALAAEAGLELVEDEGLVAENAGLTEWPVPLLGRFDEAFLDVPPEVIQLTARVNQKYFVCRSADGKLANAFVCTANIEATDGGAKIVEGNGKVLAARLSDARFFYETDRKTKLDDLRPKLEKIVFHEKLGTVADKVERVAKLARWLVEEGIVNESPPASGGGELADLAERAAYLAKADLVTGMVGEFPELQGLMGGYYAAAQGEDPRVAEAVRDHYKPVGQGDDVPTAPVTVAVALADKLDTLVAFFAVGEQPTGSKDPFAIRRAALAILRLIQVNDLRMQMARVMAASAKPVIDRILDEPYRSACNAEELIRHGFVSKTPYVADPTSITGPGAYIRTNVLLGLPALAGFFADRLKVQQREAGVRHDLIDAVFALGGEDDLVRLLARVRALQAFVITDDGTNLLAGYKRAANILKKEGVEGDQSWTAPTYTLEPAEADLIAALDAAEPKAAAAVKAEDFEAAMAALASLRAPIDRFFDDVTVNDADPAKRTARLALLARVRAAVHTVADFSRIEG